MCVSVVVSVFTNNGSFNLWIMCEFYVWPSSVLTTLIEICTKDESHREYVFICEFQAAIILYGSYFLFFSFVLKTSILIHNNSSFPRSTSRDRFIRQMYSAAQMISILQWIYFKHTNLNDAAMFFFSFRI